MNDFQDTRDANSAPETNQASSLGDTVRDTYGPGASVKTGTASNITAMQFLPDFTITNLSGEVEVTADPINFDPTIQPSEVVGGSTTVSSGVPKGVTVEVAGEPAAPDGADPAAPDGADPDAPEGADPDAPEGDLPEPQGVTDHYCITVDGKERQFDVYTPRGYDGSTPMPVMYVMAGVTGEGDQPGFMPYDTGLNQIADQEGFIVVYVYADSVDMPVVPIPPRVDSWNSPGVGLVAERPEYDDVNYVSAVIDKVNDNYNINEGAEFIVGFSEGGEMAQHVAATLGTFEGVASVHGTLLGTEAIVEDDPNNPVAPILIITGGADNMLPYDGGQGIMTVHLPRVADSQPAIQDDVWADANECEGPPTIVEDEDQVVTTYTKEQCGGNEVIEIYRKNGAHAWDGPYGSGWPVISPKDRDFDTARVVVDFFLDQIEGAEAAS